tara:strand:- start:452 stop:694 length:243 start_codon:yes stop_codon:yes gene_type:complete
MISALEELRMKNIALTPKRKEELISRLSLDEKLLYGAVLNSEEETIQILKDSDIEELDGELTFGSKSYEDGVEIHTNNKY